MEPAHGPALQALGIPLLGIGLVLAHELAEGRGDIGLGFGAGLVLDERFQFIDAAFAVEILGFQRGVEIDLGPLGNGGGDIILRDVFLDGVFNGMADHVPDDYVNVISAQDFLAHAVEGRALMIHDLVVFEKIFTGEEVALLDLFLGAQDSLADALVLDGHPLFHAEPAEDFDRPVPGKHLHELVL